ncbi:MAG: DUF883 family protein [Solidesulfovibrio sp. DCME]|uniref:DUF883 family protein n=1 Tax=Solidesulfovibrio sp. DCME TaxID=3447380 RepID=UPI003D14004C
MPVKRGYPDEAAKELREIARHAGALLDATAGEADERIRKARAQLEERLGAAREKYASLDGVLEEALDDAAAAADRVVRERPYHVVGGSFLLGLFLGWFLSRK